jgi:hypothetical protein
VDLLVLVPNTRERIPVWELLAGIKEIAAPYLINWSRGQATTIATCPDAAAPYRVKVRVVYCRSSTSLTGFLLGARFTRPGSRRVHPGTLTRTILYYVLLVFKCFGVGVFLSESEVRLFPGLCALTILYWLSEVLSFSVLCFLRREGSSFVLAQYYYSTREHLKFSHSNRDM